MFFKIDASSIVDSGHDLQLTIIPATFGMMLLPVWVDGVRGFDRKISSHPAARN